MSSSGFRPGNFTIVPGRLGALSGQCTGGDQQIQGRVGGKGQRSNELSTITLLYIKGVYKLGGDFLMVGRNINNK